MVCVCVCVCVCVSNDRYEGENCATAIETVTLKPGGSHKAHIASKSWRYFAVHVEEGNPGPLAVELIVLANATHHGRKPGLDLRSQLAVFASDSERPSDRDFRSRCLQGSGCVEGNKLALRVDRPQGKTWWVGVRSGSKDEYVTCPFPLSQETCERGGQMTGKSQTHTRTHAHDSD